MTAEEKLKDGIAKKIAEFNHLRWDKISESQKKALRSEATLIINYLHSVGVLNS